MSWNTAMHLAESTWLRAPYFLAHLGTMFALGPITGIQNTVFSGLGFVALMAIGFAIALSQAGWMYDQAAVQGLRDGRLDPAAAKRRHDRASRRPGTARQT